MSTKDPVSIEDFRNAWDKIVKSEDDLKDMPLHPFGSFRYHSSGSTFCHACRRHFKDQNCFRYSKLCLGKRKWWFFGRWKCPARPHFHVHCVICEASWFESMR